MFDIPTEFWQYLAQTSDGLGVIAFLTGMVRYIGEKKAAGEEATIADYLELVRRGEHKEICELVRNNRQALDALQELTVNISAQDTDRILSELRGQFKELKRIDAKLDQIGEHLSAPVPRRPELHARITQPLEEHVRYGNGIVALHLGLVITNRSRSVAMVTRGHAVLAFGPNPFVAKEGALNTSHKLGPNNDATEPLFISTGEVRPEGMTVRLVSIVLEIAQDDGGFRCLIPRHKMELVDMLDDIHAGQKWMAKSHEGRPVKVTLLYPSDDQQGWVVRSESSNEFEVRVTDLLPNGAVSPTKE